MMHDSSENLLSFLMVRMHTQIKLAVRNVLTFETPKERQFCVY